MSSMKKRYPSSMFPELGRMVSVCMVMVDWLVAAGKYNVLEVYVPGQSSFEVMKDCSFMPLSTETTTFPRLAPHPFVLKVSAKGRERSKGMEVMDPT